MGAAWAQAQGVVDSAVEGGSVTARLPGLLQGGAIEDLVELGSDADDVGGLEGLLQQRQARE